MLHQLQVLQRFQAAFRGMGNGWGGMLGARAGMVGLRAMFPAWVRRDARRGMAKNKHRQPETQNSAFNRALLVETMSVSCQRSTAAACIARRNCEAKTAFNYFQAA